MCIAGIVLNAHHEIPLLIFHNRDEQNDRSRNFTSAFGIDQRTCVLCASDQTALPLSQDKILRELLYCKGTDEIATLLFNRTWLGMKKVNEFEPQGTQNVFKFSFLTNIRSCENKFLSRGILIPYSLAKQPNNGVLQELLDKSSGVNLFSGNVRYRSGNPWPGVELLYRSNLPGTVDTPQLLDPGVHVVSNSVLNDFSWPKVSHLRNRINETIMPLILTNNPTENVEKILRRSADLLCEVPQFSAENIITSTKMHPGELQKQFGVYTRSTSRRSRTSFRISKLGKEIRSRPSVDDNIAWLKTCQERNKCFQTTMQTIFCVHKSAEDDVKGNPSMDCTAMFRETYDLAQHDAWKKTVVHLPRCSL